MFIDCIDKVAFCTAKTMHYGLFLFCMDRELIIYVITTNEHIGTEVILTGRRKRKSQEK